MTVKLISFIISCILLSLALANPFQAPRASEAKCGFQACNPIKPDMLNVHLIPHTHDDVGWLKTVDQYFYGSNNTIQNANVHGIIDAVMRCLLENADRRFVYVEMAFFSQWWYAQDDTMKENVKMLVNEGRLEFAGGAWSMNDEAAAHYQSIIDQFTWGTKFLNDTFGECGRPRIGWQVDPFGHSREQASLFSQMGYDGLFFARLDYQDKEKRIRDKTMEMIWESNENLGDSADIFTGALYDHYYPPNGFCFDVLCPNVQPLVDNPKSVEYNVNEKIDDFVNYVRRQAESFRTNNIALTMGGDFFYLNAIVWYENMEKMMKYTNERLENPRINVIYSTPACYLKALHDADISWPTKSDDFFPYGSDEHAYWTGYFTSRPTSKRFERQGNHFLQICKQLTAAANLTDERSEENLSRMREMMGIMQHHDAITGTEKQHVANDYHRGLSAAFAACSENIKTSFNQLYVPAESQFGFMPCINLNISDCSVSENSERFIVNVYNSLAHSTSQFIRFPVADANYEVRDSRNMLVSSHMVPISEEIKNLHYRTARATHELLFQATGVPPLGFKSYHVTRVNTPFTPVNLERINGEAVTIGNDDLKVTFDENGILMLVTVDGETSAVSQNIWMYKGSLMNNANIANRSEGAYIFRPDPRESDARVLSLTASISIHKNDLVEEVHQKFNDWISQVVRVYKSRNYVEFEWMVGPIPIDDVTNKDIISRFNSGIITNGRFKTDANGRQMIERILNYRSTWELNNTEPIAGNFYPVNTKISIEDSNHRMAILTDRAQAASGLLDGSIELMVHRRMLVDDYYGVDEALNETEYGGVGLIARGKHWMVFGKKTNQSPTLEGRERILQNEILMPNWLFFGSTSQSSNVWSANTNTMFQYSAIGKSLPENVYLMTYEPWKDNSFLIRFEHILEKNEDPELSKAVTFNLTEIFPGHGFEFSEVGLAANQYIEDVDRLKFRYSATVRIESLDLQTQDENQERVLSSPLVTINPMEIKTFVMATPRSSANKIQITLFSIILIGILGRLF